MLIEQRLDELETRIAFQEDLIDSLNETVSDQTQELRRLWEANRVLNERLKSLQDGAHQGSADQEPPPPHY